MKAFIELLNPKNNQRKKFEIDVIAESKGLILHKRASIDHEGNVYYPERQGYVISHSATGWFLIMNKTLKSIKATFHVLSELPIDWSLERPLNNLPVDIRQKIAEIRSKFHTQI